MFTRVVGSLCLTSSRSHAYSREEILILETMVQIITVSIENAKLYDRSRQSLLKAKQREESLATMNSALQVISTVLHVSELLQKFVENVANLVQAEMCTFFQLSTDEQELVAQAIYDTTGQWIAQVSLDLGDDVTVTLTRDCTDWEAGNKWVGHVRYALERQVHVVVLAKEETE